MLETFRERYDPELNREQEPWALYCNNKLMSNEKRNDSCKYELEKRLEAAFVEMLVHFYPGQAGEEVKYLKKAGYAD